MTAEAYGFPAKSPPYISWWNENDPAAAGLMRELYTVIVPCRLDRLAEVRAFVDALGLSPRLPSGRVFDLKVAVSEAVANAIEHAGAEVRLKAWLLPDRVVIEVGNDGGFGTISGRQCPERARGFGLGLMVSLADEVTFTGSRGATTEVRLTFHHGDGHAATL
jgi:anti-sigma regulatory factor (Ser/Thr protein kinase)